MSHMSNGRVERWVPAKTQKQDPLMINCVPMISFGADVDDPCHPPCPPIIETKDGKLVKLLVDYWTSQQSFRVTVQALRPIYQDTPLYLADSLKSPMPGNVTLSTEPEFGPQWGLVFEFGNPQNVGWENALMPGYTGIGTVGAVMTPPCCECLSDQKPVIIPHQILYLQPNETHCITHAALPGRSVDVTYTQMSENLATGWQPYDPTDVTSFAGRFNDQDMTAYFYNNLQPSTSNAYYGLDAGSPTLVSSLMICDWPSNSEYCASSWAIESSNDGANWDTVHIVNNHTYSPTGYHAQFTPQAARYWRVRCIQGKRDDYWVLSEIEAYSSNSSGVEQAIQGQDVAITMPSDTETCIQNLRSEPMEYTVCIY